MSCFYPMNAYYGNSKVCFGFPPLGLDPSLIFQLPCGQCGYCRMHRAREWAVRCMHEAAMHPYSCFITLTYAPEHLPVFPSLDHTHFQLFMKRLRFRFSEGVTFSRHGVDEVLCVPEGIRYYMCGEYGAKGTKRPHFHAVLFGVTFFDREVWCVKPTHTIYRSDVLDDIWGKGIATFSEVSLQSAGYCARYSMKKITGKQAAFHYRWCGPNGEERLLVPEYAKMSNRVGIGASWFIQYAEEVFPSDNVIVTGSKGRFEIKPPRYYCKLLERLDPVMFEEVKRKRIEALRDLEPRSDYQLTVQRYKHVKNMKRLVREYDECDTLKKEFVDTFDYFAAFTPYMDEQE